MRQAQSNRRGRGRGRKAQNPLTKNYESNGPDVKIRGTAAHISEKYNSLARDALAGSDIVRHENYLQHAEHYNRIIMAAQQSSQTNGQAANGQNMNGAAQGEETEAVSVAQGGSGDDTETKAKGRGDSKKSGRRRRTDNKDQRSNSNGTGNLKAAEENGALATGSTDDNRGNVDTSAGKANKDADDAAA